MRIVAGAVTVGKWLSEAVNHNTILNTIKRVPKM